MLTTVFHMLTWPEPHIFVLHRETYSEFAPEGVLANTLGIVLLAFGVLVGYVVTRDEFKRPPHPEEEALSVHFKTLTDGGSVSPWLIPFHAVLKGGGVGRSGFGE